MFFLGVAAFRWSGGTPLGLVVEEESGRIYNQGETAVVAVRAVNRSASPFHVDSVHTSCGCTKPSVGETRLASGAELPAKSTTPITVTITTERDAGEVEHSIRITGHFGDSSRVHALETKVKVVVAAKAKVVPSEILIADAEGGKPVVRDIYILEGGMKDANEVRVGNLSRPGSMHGEFHQATREVQEKVHSKGFTPARRYSLTLTPSPGETEDREFVDFILPGDGSDNRFRVNILCRKKPAGLVFSPPVLSLVKSNVHADVTREILCLNSSVDGRKLAVLRKPADIQAELKPLLKGKSSLSLRIPAARIAAGSGFEIQIGQEDGIPSAPAFRVLITEHGK
ncbi:MAG: DUF1573 domain-containing protein [Opitutaceae bacterium]|nr:DUF1573 domain-containing protein [Verrucomicrobiales bacterium]